MKHIYKAYHIATAQEFYYTFKPTKALLNKLGIDEKVDLNDWEITKCQIEAE